MKVLPSPGLLSTLMAPSITLTRSAQMANPRSAPVCSRVIEASSWLKALEQPAVALLWDARAFVARCEDDSSALGRVPSPPRSSDE